LKTIHEVEEYAAAHGVTLTAADKKKIAALQIAERDRLQKLDNAKNKTFADRWNQFYPRLLKTIVSTGETVLTFSQTVIVSLGIPVVLVLLLIVEHQRVMSGIKLFESSTALASFAGWALVLLNLVLEFQSHHIEHKSGYEQERSLRWSLRIWLSNMAYRLGIGENWNEQPLSPAARYRRLLKLVTFSILALALAGSMRSVIEKTNGAWYDALANILTQSSLLLMLTWAGGLLFAAAAVLSAQGLSRYVAIRCVEIITDMESHQTIEEDKFTVQIEQAGANVAIAIVNEKIAQKAAKNGEEIPVPLSPNGRTMN